MVPARLAVRRAPLLVFWRRRPLAARIRMSPAPKPSDSLTSNHALAVQERVP